MQERRRFRRINIDLDALIQLHRTNDSIECVIHDISRECMGAMIATPDPRVCTKEDIDLSIFIPAERTPVVCTGRIAWYYRDENKSVFGNGSSYFAGIFITDISRIDQRRLEIAIDAFRV